MLLIGPLNTASQGTAWASSLRRTGRQAECVAFDGRVARVIERRLLRDSSDRALPHYRLAPTLWRAHRIRHVLGRATHVLNESNFPFTRDPKRARFVDEVPELAHSGIRSACVFHGSDIRNPDLAIELEPHSFFRDVDKVTRARMAAVAEANRERVIRSGVPTFVTTADLLDHLPGSRLLPLTIDTGLWSAATTPFRTTIPRVLHRTGGGSTPTKGTVEIVPVLDELERQGRIRVVRSDVVHHTKMKALIESADIVVDQIRSGAYGVTAIEAMALGRLVVANINPRVEAAMGGDVPIVNADPSNFRDALEEVLQDVPAAQATAGAGRAFVQRWHCGRAASIALTEFLCSSQ